MLSVVGALAVAATAGMSWERVMLTAAHGRGAKCLDGSPGGYFFRRGDPREWVVFHQGGGWCTNTVDCAARAFGKDGKGHPWLGGSTAWPTTYVDKYEGSQVQNPPLIPLWHFWKFIIRHHAG